MPRSPVPGFVGPSNVLQSTKMDCELSVNWYVEPAAPGKGKSQAYLRPTPKTVPRYILPTMPVTAEFVQQDNMYVIAGNTFYEVFDGGAYVAYGTVAEASGVFPTICSNGTGGFQLFITAGYNGYIFDISTNTLSAITDPDFPNGSALMGEYLDGYFLVLKRFSRTWQFSALEDGTSWDALDVNERSRGSDYIVALIRNHTEIWLLGIKTSEAWYNQGDPLTPFAPIQGVFLETGLEAGAFNVVRVDNTLAWVNHSERGVGMVVRANGYTPERLTTFAMARDTVSPYRASFAPFPEGQVGWTYQQDDHLFYVLQLPGKDKTLVYDFSTGAWHHRALWDTTACVWRPDLGICHAYFHGKHLVGDRYSGTIYELVEWASPSLDS